MIRNREAPLDYEGRLCYVQKVSTAAVTFVGGRGDQAFLLMSLQFDNPVFYTAVVPPSFWGSVCVDGHGLSVAFPK